MHDEGATGGYSGGNGFGYRNRFADADFDEVALTLHVGGQQKSVEPLPLRVLAELLRRPNEAVTREELLDCLWPDSTGEDPVTDHVLTSAVSRLKQALGSQAASRIESVRRVGYRFAGAVDRIAVGRRAAMLLPLVRDKRSPVGRSCGSSGRSAAAPTPFGWLAA